MSGLSAVQAACVGDLHSRLRSTTRPAHERLESSLGLGGPTVPEARVVRLLERLHGFHAAWEPTLAGVVPDALRLPRLRLRLLREDLQRLGVDTERLRALPLCHDAVALCASEADAAGALYVLEGSTLGGRVISRSLERAPWLAGRRLRYWDPYGEDTGRRWQETLGYLESLPATAWDSVIASAVATFDLLNAWLAAPAASSEQAAS